MKVVNSSLSEPGTEMDNLERIRTCDENFGIHLKDHGVYPEDGYVTPPENLAEIQGMLGQPRPSESYDVQYQAFRQASLEVKDKNDVKNKIFPFIAGQCRFHTSGGHSFQDLADLTDGHIVKALPDFYDGADPYSLERELLTELSSFIKPLPAKRCPVVPNFYVIFNGSSQEPFVLDIMTRYSGALGARAIHKLRSFGIDDPEIVFDNNAYTITATYSQGTIYLYAHRPIRPPVLGGVVDYRMSLVGGYALINSPDTLRQGVEAFRNAREWAMGRRDEFIAAANVRLQATGRTQRTARTTTTPVPASSTPNCILS